jgi:hypothetical protein
VSTSARQHEGLTFDPRLGLCDVGWLVLAEGVLENLSSFDPKLGHAVGQVGEGHFEPAGFLSDAVVFGVALTGHGQGEVGFVVARDSDNGAGVGRRRARRIIDVGFCLHPQFHLRRDLPFATERCCHCGTAEMKGRELSLAPSPSEMHRAQCAIPLHG